MFNKNVFTQKDPIADLVKPMLEAQTKAKMEELKGNQKVLDKNKNNKLDAQDFKMLRKEEDELEESSPFDWKKPREPEVKGGAGVKKGRAYGGSAQKSKPEQDDADDKKKVKEEVEQIDELKKSTVGSYVQKATRDAADHAVTLGYKAGRREGGIEAGEKLNRRVKGLERVGKRLAKEEVEQIDELKKSTLASYAKKATDDVGYHAIKAGMEVGNGNKVSSLKHDKKSMSRQAGVNRAIDRLAKEEVEQVEERSLTSGEKADMEKNVKGMKKNLAGFKARYGTRAKSVMYATATKNAKKD